MSDGLTVPPTIVLVLKNQKLPFAQTAADGGNEPFSHVLHVAWEQLVTNGADKLSWYQSSSSAERAFCQTCGSQLFWNELDRAKISVMVGTLDGLTGLKMGRQICTETKGDYYARPDVKTVEQSTLQSRINNRPPKFDQRSHPEKHPLDLRLSQTDPVRTRGRNS